MRNFPKNTFTGLITKIRVVVVVIIVVIVAVGWRRRPSLRCATRSSTPSTKTVCDQQQMSARSTLDFARTGVVFTARTWPRPLLIRLGRTRTDPCTRVRTAGVQYARGQCEIITFVESAKNGRFAEERLHRAPGLDDFNYQSGVRKPVRSQAPFRTPSGHCIAAITFSTRQRRHKLRRKPSSCNLIAFAISSDNAMGDKILFSPSSPFESKICFHLSPSRPGYFDLIYSPETSATVEETQWKPTTCRYVPSTCHRGQCISSRCTSDRSLRDVNVTDLVPGQIVVHSQCAARNRNLNFTLGRPSCPVWAKSPGVGYVDGACIACNRLLVGTSYF